MTKELIEELCDAIESRAEQCRTAKDEALELALSAMDEECISDDDPLYTERTEPHELDKIDAVLRDGVRMMLVVRKLLVGRSFDEIYAAFGAPGNWGYGTPIGDALRKFYKDARREERAVQKDPSK